MMPGFGLSVTREVVRKLQEQEVDEALWVINEQQALLHREKVLTERAVRLLKTDELNKLEWNRKRKGMTIGKTSRERGVPSSAIRHWEREGLLSLPRDPGSDEGTGTQPLGKYPESRPGFPGQTE